ncbi:MAG: Na+/H+ antiporter NhaC [Halobacteriovoraceae bacterium]|nr:Na+/H+ antiporter NhaC [Halobacteriovoraceae bacterium]MCB9093605.1 Na+/H+ antiporter NhaC [Halobacteriovoraceae bacterium]
MKKSESEISIFEAILPVIVLVVLLIVNVKIYKDNATAGPNQMALFLSGFVAMLMGKLLRKLNYYDLELAAIHSIKHSMQANLILLSVGSLIGIWILSGVVPTMIYYGIKIMSPQFFLPTACLICSFVSLATGSSWSTGGTVGIALIGVGQTLGIPLPMVAGAVISGSYFGDKLSPLSDTTNLAPAMAGSNLFDHIRYLLITTIPAITLAVLGFFVLGLQFSSHEVVLDQVNEVMSVIEKAFYISPLMFLAPGLVLFLVYKKLPALPSMLLGTLAGVVLALFFQEKLLGSNSYEVIIKVASDGFVSETGNSFVDSLFSRGGMSSMLNTVWLIMMAMFFGGMMEACGYLETLAMHLLKFVSGVGTLVGATLASCIFLNITASDQYLSIVVAGRMFREAYQKFGLAPVNLSRTLEDGGTVTSVLVPWNSGGAYFSNILGVETLSYLPYCFFNLVTPLVSIFIASFKIGILKASDNIDAA